MSDRDKKRIITSLGAADADGDPAEENVPLGVVKVTGWDKEDETPQAHNGQQFYLDEINDDEQYSHVTHLNTIFPYPSQVLLVFFKNLPLPITFDSGASVAYIRFDVVKSLFVKIYPNNQLASLAGK